MMRNVLLLTIDAFGADKCWEKCSSLIPALNCLKSQGVVCSQAIAATSSTTSSIASIHTGLYPKQHGIESTYGYHLKDSVTPLAEILKTNGYNTFANVGGPLFPKTGLNRGFDNYTYRASEFVPRLWRWGVVIKRMELNNFLLRREAKSIFRKQSPWFYWIHLLHLHNRWRGKTWVKNFKLSDYENAFSSLDKIIHFIISSVDLENTILVVCADHGHHVTSLDPPRPEVKWPEGHGFHIYDTLVHVPLFFIAKGLVPQHVTVERQVSSVDILPTITDLLGLDRPPQGVGESIVGLMNHKQSDQADMASHNKYAYMEACGGFFKHTGQAFLMGIRTEKWKYVMSQDLHSGREPELYDLAHDADELYNVRKNFPEIEKNMRHKLLKFQARQ